MLHWIYMFADILAQLPHNQFNTSIWGDEGFSAILSFKPFPDLIRTIINDTSPPLWNITERLAFLTFGTSEVVIRGLAFIYFLLTIFFVYKIGKHYWDKKTGMLAAALAFLNPFFFIYAFEGRMYSILALGVTASMYFFITKQWKSYVAATTWALYSHHFAIFALMIQGVWFLYELVTKKKETVRLRLKSFVVVGILYIPWLWPLYNQTRMVGGGFWLATPTLKDLKVLIYDYLAQGIKTKEVTLPFLPDYPLYDIALWVAFAGLALRKWHQSIKKTVFLLLWFLGPILLTWGVSQVFTSVFFNRYLLYTIPAAMLILASKRRSQYSTIVLSILMALFVFIDFHYFTHPTKLPFKEMSAWVKHTRQEGDFIVNWGGGSHHLWETKYYGIAGPIYIPDGGDLPFFVGTALMEDDDIIHTLPEGVARVGVVTSRSFEDIMMPEDFVVEQSNEMRGLRFVWYEKVE